MSTPNEQLKSFKLYQIIFNIGNDLNKLLLTEH